MVHSLLEPIIQFSLGEWHGRRNEMPEPTRSLSVVLFHVAPLELAHVRFPARRMDTQPADISFEVTKPTVHLVEATVHLLEARVDLVEALVDVLSKVSKVRLDYHELGLHTTNPLVKMGKLVP